MGIVSIRGAITAEQNTRDSILESATEMLKSILIANNLEIKDLVQLHFSCTKDLDAAYPAVAARELGITEATLMCFQEMYVINSLQKCIRVDMIVEKDNFDKSSVKHQYLKGAVCLRPDLVKKE